MPEPTNSDAPISAAMLDYLFRPRSIAFVGASDKNLFSRRAFAQHQRIASSRPLTLVNPRTRRVHGVDTVASCTDIEGGIECAYLLTPQHVTSQALTDAVAAGARAAVVLSQGWAEEGPSGTERQRELVAQAHDQGVVLLGPNHLGFANLHDGIAACGLGLDMPIEPGALGLVSQSGAVGSSMVGYAARQDVRFSFVVTTGNEAMVSIADAVNYLLDDQHTRAIAIFAETIRKPALFRAAADKAASLGKALVILKAGTSELAARTAEAHTGALVGDDRVIDALLRQSGVIRVRSLEDLISTANLAAQVGPLRAGGVGVLSVSGGACDLIADRGEEVGLELPTLSAETAASLQELLPPYGHAQNPLDVTGGALADPNVWRKGIEAMAEEQSIGLIGVVTSLPTAGESQRDDTFHAVGETLAKVGLPGVIFPQIEQAPSDYVREVKEASGVAIVLPSVERFTFAASHLARWSNWLRTRPDSVALAGAQRPARIEVPQTDSAEGHLSEGQGRALLEDAGVPVVPAVLATTLEGALVAAAALEGKVVLKMCSAQVAHKTEIGGVELNIEGPAAATDAYRRMVDRALAAGVALEVLVSPMRSGGLELIVGVVRDDAWGQVLAVGMGGALVELLDDSALRVLPVTGAEVRTMLGELRGFRLLGGFRGSKPADIDSLVEVIVSIAQLGANVGDRVKALEVNPLLVDGDRIEALDVLVTRG